MNDIRGLFGTLARMAETEKEDEKTISKDSAEVIIKTLRTEYFGLKHNYEYRCGIIADYASSISETRDKMNKLRYSIQELGGNVNENNQDDDDE
jgi:hypothetical protein